MLKRLSISVLLVVLGAGGAIAVWGSWIAPHDASGDVSTATSATEELHICQPSGTTTVPMCPVDTNGADEAIFTSNENLIPGAVAWQKLRLTNVGTLPWDVLGMTTAWTKVTDPSGVCNIVPEGVRWNGSGAVMGGTSETGVTLLGTNPASSQAANYRQEPFEGIWYYAPFHGSQSDPSETLNDNATASGSVEPFYSLSSHETQDIHVAPGGYEDVLLGIRLPVTAPDSCLGVVWQLTTTWNVQNDLP